MTKHNSIETQVPKIRIFFYPKIITHLQKLSLFIREKRFMRKKFFKSILGTTATFCFPPHLPFITNAHSLDNIDFTRLALNWNLFPLIEWSSLSFYIFFTCTFNTFHKGPVFNTFQMGQIVFKQDDTLSHSGTFIFCFLRNLFFVWLVFLDHCQDWNMTLFKVFVWRQPFSSWPSIFMILSMKCSFTNTFGAHEIPNHHYA